MWEGGGTQAGRAAAAAERMLVQRPRRGAAMVVVLPPGVAMEEGNLFEWTSAQGQQLRRGVRLHVSGGEGCGVTAAHGSWEPQC